MISQKPRFFLSYCYDGIRALLEKNPLPQPQSHHLTESFVAREVDDSISFVFDFIITACRIYSTSSSLQCFAFSDQLKKKRAFYLLHKRQLL